MQEIADSVCDEIPAIRTRILLNDHDALFAELEPVVRARPKAPLAEHYAFLFGWLRDHMDKDLWIERSGASLTFVLPLREMYPDAKFIHLFRDGRDVAMSNTKTHAATQLTSIQECSFSLSIATHGHTHWQVHARKRVWHDVVAFAC